MWDLIRDFFIDHYFIHFVLIFASCILGFFFIHSENFLTRLLFTLLVVLASILMILGISSELYRAICLIIVFVGVFCVVKNALFAAGTDDAGSTSDTIRWTNLPESESIERGYVRGKVYLGSLLLMDIINLAQHQ